MEFVKDYVYTFNPKTNRRARRELKTVDTCGRNEYSVVECPMTKAGKVLESGLRVIAYGFTPSYEDSKRAFEDKITEGVVFAFTREALEASIQKWENSERDWKVMLELIH